MKCIHCNRELRDDSKFCDFCGNPVPRDINPKVETKFDFKALIYGLALSVIITFFILILFRTLGFSIIIGGLFLPFLWKKVVKNNNKRD